MSTLPINDTELFYRDRGADGETIVFSHGLLFDHRMFDHQVEALGDRYRCVAYDHRGQGESREADTPVVDMETLYFDAVEVIERFDVGPCHFVGVSMGGFVGMRLAARRPDLVASLTLIATRAGREPDENVPKYKRLNTVARLFGVELVSDRIMPLMFGKSFMESDAATRRREVWRRRLEANTNDVYRAVNGVLYRPSCASELPQIEVPTLVMHGDQDRAVAPEAGRELADSISTAEFVSIPEVGHSPPIERPDEVSERLGEFFDRAGS